jgi:hypothetical protein
MSQRPPDCPIAGTINASIQLKRLIIEVREIEEFLVSKIKQT